MLQLCFLFKGGSGFFVCGGSWIFCLMVVVSFVLMMVVGFFVYYVVGFLCLWWWLGFLFNVGGGLFVYCDG